jgi:hypothetical protein
MNKFWGFILIVIIGGLAGLLGGQFLTPYLRYISPFDQISWLKDGNNGTTIIQKTEEKTINESTAIEDAISRVDPLVVGVVGQSKSAISKNAKKIPPTTILAGTGFLVTSDGLVVAASSTAPEKNYDFVVILNGKFVPAEVIKRDDALGLALLRIQQSNLPVVSWADFDSLRLGARMILFGFGVAEKSIGPDKTPFVTKFVDLGIANEFSGKNFSVSIKGENPKANGAPIITILGEVAGMALVDKGGDLKIVPSDTIRVFLGP